MVATYTDLDEALLPPLDVEDEDPETKIIYGAQPPKWYRKPPRPELAEVLDAAEEERNVHSDRIRQSMRFQDLINDPKMAGVFESLVRDVVLKKVEQVSLPGLRDETDMIVSTFAQMDWVVEAEYRSNLDKDDAAAKEDLCAYLQENAQRQYSNSGGGSLKAAKMWDLCVCGGVAEFNGVDVDNDECGLRMRLVDPNTVYPVYEGERGLSQVYLKYQSTASDFIGTFGSLKDFDELAVRRKARANAGGTENGHFDPHYLGEVVEFWDRNWCLISWESEEVLVLEHEYAEVPFKITPGNFGQPAHIVSNSSTRGRDIAWSADRSKDLLRIWQPFLQRRVFLHQLNEAVAGVTTTKLVRGLNPARTVAAGVLTYEDESPKWKDGTGETTMLRAEDTYDVNEASISMDPQVASATFALIQQGMATSTPSSIIAGQAPMSQGSGTALNVLARAGAERWGLAGEVMMQHEAGSNEQRLRFIRNFGNLLGMDGTIYAPRRRPNPRTGDSPVHEVTPDLLKKTGVRVKVVFRRFNPNELGSLSQGIGMLRSINLMPKRDAIEILGYTDDPDRAMADMDREMLNEAPEITQVNMLDMLIDELKEAGWRGEDEDAEKLFYKLMYVSDRLDISANQRKAEGMQASMAANPPIPGVNGMPLPGAGQPGTDGGRPSLPPGAAVPGIAPVPPVGPQ